MVVCVSWMFNSHQKFSLLQCFGSMTYWGGSGSGSADPCLWLMDQDPVSDPDPGSGSCYRHWPSSCHQKIIWTQVYLDFYLLIAHLMFFEHVQLIFRSCSSNLPIVFILSTHHVHFPLMFIFPSCSFPSHAHLSQLISVHHALLPPSPPHHRPSSSLQPSILFTCSIGLLLWTTCWTPG